MSTLAIASVKEGVYNIMFFIICYTVNIYCECYIHNGECYAREGPLDDDNI